MATVQPMHVYVVQETDYDYANTHPYVFLTREDAEAYLADARQKLNDEYKEQADYMYQIDCQIADEHGVCVQPYPDYTHPHHLSIQELDVAIEWPPSGAVSPQ